MSTKKRKHSGLSEGELQLAYNSLLKLKDSISHVKSAEENPQEGFEQAVESMLSLLRSKLEEPQLTFSGMTYERLTKLKITFAGHINLKARFEERLAATVSLGQSELWSSENLYRQLRLLESLVPRTNEASARAWIDAFFFRVSAMIPQDQSMLLNMEHTIPATTVSPSSLTSLSGFADYTAIVAHQSVAAFLLRAPHLQLIKYYELSGFFVMEAKFSDPENHVPQAVCEMYTCGKILQKNVIRGALTSGRDWIFIIVKFNDNYDGASYKHSNRLDFSVAKGSDGQPVVSKPEPDLIAAVLEHWIVNSFKDLEKDDWFE